MLRFLKNLKNHFPDKTKTFLYNENGKISTEILETGVKNLDQMTSWRPNQDDCKSISSREAVLCNCRVSFFSFNLRQWSRKCVMQSCGYFFRSLCRFYAARWTSGGGRWITRPMDFPFRLVRGVLPPTSGTPLTRTGPHVLGKWKRVAGKE